MVEFFKNGLEDAQIEFLSRIEIIIRFLKKKKRGQWIFWVHIRDQCTAHSRKILHTQLLLGKTQENGRHCAYYKPCTILILIQFLFLFFFDTFFLFCLI